MAVYTYFAKNTIYRESADAHTGYDVLVKHVGVCDGLANAYALAMNTLGIPCAVVSNYSKNHSWNVIKLNGKWYYVDLTNGVGTGKHEGAVVSYESFLVGKKGFLKTHPGYKVKDLYGQGNSNDLNMRGIPISNSDYIKDNKLKVDKNKIKINKYTNYEIIDEGINIYFNPYKSSKEDLAYEFKIPFTIFKNKIKKIQTSSIIANIDTQTITKNNKYINSIINIPIIMIDNKDISKNINDEITNSIMKFFNDSQKQAKEYNDALPEVENKFVANVDFDVKKNSDNILSILIKYYKYAGGAHGYYENVAYNIDIRNGNIITIDNLFKEGSDYKNIINEEIRNQIEELIKLDEQNKGVYEFKSIEDKQKFYIQDDNIVVYFDLYDIAPYAAGIPEFIINVNKIDHILKPEYKEIFK